MIIDEKGRLFGKISVVDIVIVLFLIFAVTALVWHFTGMRDATDKIKAIPCRYEFLVENVSAEVADALESEIGSDAYEQNKKSVGKLVSVEKKPYESPIVNTKGEIKFATVPERYAVTLVIDGKGKKTTAGYIVGSGNEIKVGETKNISFYGVDIKARVENISETK